MIFNHPVYIGSNITKWFHFWAESELNICTTLIGCMNIQRLFLWYISHWTAAHNDFEQKKHDLQRFYKWLNW